MNLFLKSERLILREFEESDVDNLYALNSDPEVMKYIGTGKPVMEKDKIKSTIDLILSKKAEQRKSGLGIWVSETRVDNKFIGFFALKYLDKSEEIEIGYRLMKFAWGKGYAGEMSKVLLRYGFEIIGLGRIVGVTHPGNLISQKVLLKIGLRFEKTANFYNNVVKYFSINKDEFQRQNN